jgi:hypothetical protein
MASLFTTDTLNYKRDKQKTVYQETYDDCNFAFEFVPMNADEKFCKQAFLEAYVEVDGFEQVDAVGYLDVSYSKIDQFNRLFYFISDDADPSIHGVDSLENVSYGILGTNGVNPFNNVKDELFPFSDSMIKAGYANNTPTYTENTKLCHDYIRYTAKAISGGYSLSDIFANEKELIHAVGEMDASFNMDFSKKINDLSGCVHEGKSNEGWNACKSLVTGLLDFSNEMDTTTTRFKRGTKFLKDLAEQSINTFESEKNTSQGEFWVKFHPGDAIAVRLTYNPENGNGNPAKNQNGEIGSNKLYDRSYKIYLRFNDATASEVTHDITTEFLNIVKYESDADKAIGQKTVHMPALLSETLNTMTLAKDAIDKSYEKVDELKNQFSEVIQKNNVSTTNVSASNSSGNVSLAKRQLNAASGYTSDIKTELNEATTLLNNVSNFNKDVTFFDACSKIESSYDIMTHMADSVMNIANIVTAKNALNNVSRVIPKTYDVMERTRKYAELNVSNVTPLLQRYENNMSTTISQLNENASSSLVNSSRLIHEDIRVITSEKRNAYKEFVFASVALDAVKCREHARKANEHATVTEKLSDEIIIEFNNVSNVVENVSNMTYQLKELVTKLGSLQSTVSATVGFSGVNDNTKNIVGSLSANMHTLDNTLLTHIELSDYYGRALINKLDSKLKNIQSFYHAENAKNVADMWITNEEVARSNATKIEALTAAKIAFFVDAENLYDTALSTKSTAESNKLQANTDRDKAVTYFNNISTQYETANASSIENQGKYTTALGLKNEAVTAMDAANLAAQLGLSAANSEDEKVAQIKIRLSKAIEDAKAARSNALVLRSTATTLNVTAFTEYEKATVLNASTLAKEAEDDADDSDGIVRGIEEELSSAVALATSARSTSVNKTAAAKSATDAAKAAEEVLALALKAKNDADTSAKILLDAKIAAEQNKLDAIEHAILANETFDNASTDAENARGALVSATNAKNAAILADDVAADLAADVASAKDPSVIAAAAYKAALAYNIAAAAAAAADTAENDYLISLELADAELLLSISADNAESSARIDKDYADFTLLEADLNLTNARDIAAAAAATVNGFIQ